MSVVSFLFRAVLTCPPGSAEPCEPGLPAVDPLAGLLQPELMIGLAAGVAILLVLGVFFVRMVARGRSG